MAVSGWVTSSGIQMPPSSAIWGLAWAAVVGLRAVARTLWPAWRAQRARAVPRPEEAPVMSQVWDMVGWMMGWMVEVGCCGRSYMVIRCDCRGLRA